MDRRGLRTTPASDPHGVAAAFGRRGTAERAATLRRDGALHTAPLWTPISLDADHVNSTEMAGDSAGLGPRQRRQDALGSWSR